MFSDKIAIKLLGISMMLNGIIQLVVYVKSIKRQKEINQILGKEEGEND